MRFQAIAWETADIKSSRLDALEGAVAFERNDQVMDTLYTPNVKAVPRHVLSTQMVDVFAVRVCGRSMAGGSAFLELRGFRPYFYVYVEDLPVPMLDALVDAVTSDFRFRNLKLHLVLKTPFVGFHKTPHKFMRVECLSKGMFFGARKFFREYHTSEHATLATPLMMYESMCDPLVQFWIAYRLNPMAWIDVDTEVLSSSLAFRVDEVAFVTDVPDMAPFKVVHYDLECFSSVAYETGKNNMPNPALPADVIIGIGAVVTSSTSPAILERVYFGMNPLGPSSDATIDMRGFDTEEGMLSAFCRWLDDTDPDIWNGFNNFGFDDNYLHTRLGLYGIEDQLNSRGFDVEIRKKNFASNAFQFDAHYLQMPLRFFMDLLIFARREFKTEMTKFTLENVSQILLHEGKHDVSPQEIFDAWATRNAGQLTRVGEYCVQDCALVARIMDFKQVYSTLFSRSELFLCDPRDLLLKGQQQIVFNLIFQQVRTATNFCVPDSAEVAMDQFESDASSESESEDAEAEFTVAASSRAGAGPGAGRGGPPKKVKFKGATVLEPKKGAYMCPVSGLDFASLYPSIMTAYNLCHSTKLLSTDAAEGIPPEQLYTTELSGGRVSTFVQKDYRRGVLPQILLNLWAMRKRVKKLMAQAKESRDRNLHAIYNAKQLAVKVAMNSIYGFCGADNGKLPMKDIAETVTANGRMLIERSKNYVESWYPCEVVYGDTDSIYVRFFLDELEPRLQNPRTPEDVRELMQWVFQRSQEAADRITANYISPIELEFEKVMFPFVLFKKKRYTYVEYEKFDEVIDEDSVNMKGIAPTRRDYAPFVKRVCTGAIHKILLDRDVDGAFRYVEEEMMRLLKGQYPIEDLVVSRSLSKRPDQYANPNTPHVALALRIEERTGVRTRLGERIQFVFTKGSGAQCDLVEEPQFVRQEDADGAYYFFHQIHHSLEEILGTVDLTRWTALDMRLTTRARGLHMITDFFTPKRAPEQTEKVERAAAEPPTKKPAQKRIDSFFVKK